MNTTATEQSKLEQYPIFATVGSTVFPGMTLDIDVKSPDGMSAVKRALDSDAILFLAGYKHAIMRAEDLEITADSIERVGTMVRIQRTTIGPDASPRILVRGIARAKLIEVIPHPDGGADAKFLSIRKSINPSSARAVSLVKQLQEALDSFCQRLSAPPPESIKRTSVSFSDPGAFADFIVSQLAYSHEFKQHILAMTDPEVRAVEVLAWLESERARMDVDEEIRRKVKERLEGNQREYRLREQLRVIRNELGESDESDDEEIVEYRDRIAKAHLPGEVEEKLLKEVGKLAKTPYASAESTVLRQYLDICLEVPWGKTSGERRNVAQARRVLEHDHSGMEKVKDRILEFIAVRARNPELKNQILCLVGAPGTGKTSVSASIAKALGRKFVRVCLGGIRDEAEIRGHRKTYIGAMPGRIVTALRQAEVMNPVILLDEIDKMTADAHGDPTAAMLEVLDAEQNYRFRDHFLELPVDLSDCIFIATANTRTSIPAPLLDRMELIDLPPYLRSEKLRIAKEHLLPKQMKRHGLSGRVLRVSDTALLEVIDTYTREAGVRNLERELASICRKAAKKLVDDGKDSLIRISPPDLAKWLGPSRLTPETIPEEDEIGAVNGLAWTEAGGSMLRVEATSMEGSGKLSLTGSLGDVMKESAQLAVSYLRANADRYGIDPNFHKNRDLHIHLPEGAVPKDGPSAGVTLTTALLSELTGRKVRRDIAMTGEISLRGNVLPIGGLREKTTAAHRAGVKTVLIPTGNRADLDEIPSEIRESLTFLPVSRVEQVLDAALLPKED